MALSVLARLYRKGRFAEFETGESGPRTSSKNPALKGFARGTMGSIGSTTLKHRNSQAGEQADREMLGSPIMQAYLSRIGGTR